MPGFVYFCVRAWRALCAVAPKAPVTPPHELAQEHLRRRLL